MKNDELQVNLEAAAFRQLVKHLRDRPEIQNIELMSVADFCRNCLSKWYIAAAKERGIDIQYDDARQIIYGMPYGEWKALYQTEATPDQKLAYEAHLSSEKKAH